MTFKIPKKYVNMLGEFKYKRKKVKVKKSEFGTGNLPRHVVDISEHLKVEKNDVVKNSPPEDNDFLNEIKMKEKDDKTEKVESSKDDPNKSIPNSNSNVTFVNLFNTRSCKRSETLIKSLLFWLAREVSWLAVEVLSPYRK